VIALDTNVLVRYLVDDDPEQTRRAAKLIESGTEAHFVAHIVLCELVWVLGSSYKRPKTDIVAALRGLLEAIQLEIEAPELAHRALARFESGSAGFADYLIEERARTAGCERVATFDKALLREPSFFSP